MKDTTYWKKSQLNMKFTLLESQYQTNNNYSHAVKGKQTEFLAKSSFQRKFDI